MAKTLDEKIPFIASSTLSFLKYGEPILDSCLKSCPNPKKIFSLDISFQNLKKNLIFYIKSNQPFFLKEKRK